MCVGACFWLIGQKMKKSWWKQTPINLGQSYACISLNLKWYISACSVSRSVNFESSAANNPHPRVERCLVAGPETLHTDTVGTRGQEPGGWKWTGGRRVGRSSGSGGGRRRLRPLRRLHSGSRVSQFFNISLLKNICFFIKKNTNLLFKKCKKVIILIAKIKIIHYWKLYLQRWIKRVLATL